MCFEKWPSTAELGPMRNRADPPLRMFALMVHLDPESKCCHSLIWQWGVWLGILYVQHWWRPSLSDTLRMGSMCLVTAPFQFHITMYKMLVPFCSPDSQRSLGFLRAYIHAAQELLSVKTISCLYFLELLFMGQDTFRNTKHLASVFMTV